MRKVKGVEKRDDFRAAMNKLENSTNPRLKLIATNVLKGKDLSESLKDVQPGSVLDFQYFVSKIEPILATPGRDGKACVFCHGTDGSGRTPVGTNLYPRVPDLRAFLTQDLTDGDLHYIIENGVQLTGMPAGIAHHAASADDT